MAGWGEYLARQVRALENQYLLMEEYIGMKVKVCAGDACWRGCLAEVKPEALAVILRPAEPEEEGEPAPREVVVLTTGITDLSVYGPCGGDAGGGEGGG